MNVLQICYKYPPFFSGYGIQLRTINKELVKSESINITVITAYGYKGVSQPDNGIEVKSIFKRKKEGGLFHYIIFCFFSVILYFYNFLKADVVHIVKAGPEVIIPIFFSKVFNKKVIVKIAQNDLENLLSKDLKTIRKIRKKP